MRTHSLWNEYYPAWCSHGVADLIESYGQNPDQVARSAGVNPELLYRPDLPLPALAYNALMESAALACDDQFLLLRLAEVQSWRLIGPIDALVKTGSHRARNARASGPIHRATQPGPVCLS